VQRNNPKEEFKLSLTHQKIGVEGVSPGASDDLKQWFYIQGSSSLELGLY
jgi:hypothetical protein